MTVLIIILAFGKLRQDDCKFEGSLAHIVSLLKQTSKCSSLDDMGKTERKMTVSWTSRYPCRHRGERYHTSEQTT